MVLDWNSFYSASIQSIPLVLNRNEGIDVAVPCHDSRPISTAVLHPFKFLHLKKMTQ